MCQRMLYMYIHICQNKLYTGRPLKPITTPAPYAIDVSSCVHVFVQQLENECETRRGQNLFRIIFNLYFYSMDMNRYKNVSTKIIQKDCEAQVK